MLVETGSPLYVILETENKNDIIVYGFPVAAYLLQTYFPHEMGRLIRPMSLCKPVFLIVHNL